MKKLGVLSEELILSRLRQVSKCVASPPCSDVATQAPRGTVERRRKQGIRVELIMNSRLSRRVCAFVNKHRSGRSSGGNLKNSVMRNLADCVIYQSDPSPLRGRKKDEAMIFHLFPNLFMRVCPRKEKNEEAKSRETEAMSKFNVKFPIRLENQSTPSSVQ